MRILQITPGTGTFYCGSCLRDHALARQLRRLGHDALLAPMYLPARLDEPDADPGSPLFFGGLNVFLQQHAAAFRLTPRWLDRWLDHPALLRLLARHAHLTRPSDHGNLTLSMLRGEEGRQAKELDRLVAWIGAHARPDVVCLSNALLIGLARRIRAALGLPVVCTLQGEDSFLDALPQSHREQAWDLLAQRAREIDGFIAVSHYYARTMQRRLGLDPARLHVVPNGIGLEGHTPAPVEPDPPVLGYLARMCQDKGLPALIDIFLRLADPARSRLPGLRLAIAGACTKADEPLVRAMRQRLEARGLSARVDWRPNLDRPDKLRFLQQISLLCVPATYGESFGLYVIEALASGVPVVEPDHAAFPELIDATGGGLLFRPGDAEDAAGRIEELLLDAPRRRAMAQRGRAAVMERFGIERMAGDVAGVLESVLRASRRDTLVAPAPAG